METLTSDQWNRLGQLYVQQKLNKAGRALVEMEVQRNPDYRNYIRQEQVIYDALTEAEEQLRWNAISTRAKELQNAQIKDPARPIVHDNWLVRTERIPNVLDQGKSKLRIRLKPAAIFLIGLIIVGTGFGLYLKLNKSSQLLTINAKIPAFYGLETEQLDSFSNDQFPSDSLFVQVITDDDATVPTYRLDKDTLKISVKQLKVDMLDNWRVLFQDSSTVNPLRSIRKYTLLRPQHVPLKLMENKDKALPLP